MSLEAKRFIASIKRGFLEDKIDVEIPVIGQPFFERFNDHIGGIALDVNIIVNEYLDACYQYTDFEYPNDLPNLYAWYDFQDQSTITLTGGTQITQVLDKSGNDFTLTPFSATPSYSASTYTNNSDGYYAMWDTRLSTALGHNTPDKTWTEGTSFVVHTRPDNGVKGIWGIITGATTVVINNSAFGNGIIGEDIITWSTIACREAEYDDDYSGNTFSITTQRANSLTIGDMDGRDYTKYGLLPADINDCVSQPSNKSDYIILGHNSSNDGVEVLSGIMEVIVYDRALTDSEYSKVTEYLKLKYNYSNWS